MRCIFTLLFLSLCLFGLGQTDSAIIRKIYDYHLTQSNTYKNEEYLSTQIGARLSGSPQAAKAVEWAKKAMYDAGADTVYLIPCMVPHWVRGEKEECKLISTVNKKTTALNICALGGSVSTPLNGLVAEVIEVNSYEELKKLGSEKIKGKIVFYNVKLDPRHIHTGSAYGEAVKYRSKGAIEAARYGAIASIVRSMTLTLNDFPHTGSMSYDTIITKIPSCAISTIGAVKLSEALKKDVHTKLSLKLNCKTLPDEPSYSVVGEIKGSSHSDEIILAGGHLDSWDLGQGAHDDASGITQTIEVLSTFKKLNIQPYRTIRAVAFMNEENGARGGKSYAEMADKNNLHHLIAIESDAGGFTPRAISIDADEQYINLLKKWQYLFIPYDLTIKKGWGGVDIEPLKKLGTICLGLEPDSQRYFDYHHTADDTFDKINKRELELGAAAISSFIYLIDRYGLN